jgi:hypothetical protein
MEMVKTQLVSFAEFGILFMPRSVCSRRQIVAHCERKSQLDLPVSFS